MAKLKVMCARSMHVAAGALGQAFAAQGGHTVDFDFGTVGALQAKLDAGATAEGVILSVPAIEKLAQAGVNSRKRLGDHGSQAVQIAPEGQRFQSLLLFSGEANHRGASGGVGQAAARFALIMRPLSSVVQRASRYQTLPGYCTVESRSDIAHDLSQPAD